MVKCARITHAWKSSYSFFPPFLLRVGAKKFPPEKLENKMSLRNKKRQANKEKDSICSNPQKNRLMFVHRERQNRWKQKQKNLIFCLLNYCSGKRMRNVSFEIVFFVHEINVRGFFINKIPLKSFCCNTTTKQNKTVKIVIDHD